MDNQKFMNDFNRDVVQDKTLLKSKNESIVKELNDTRKMFDIEMEREDRTYDLNPLFQSDDNNYMFEEIVKHDADNGDMLDFYEMDDDAYDVMKELALNDPSFALSFIERRRAEIPEEKYQSMKKELLNRMNIL
ncbi:MAG: hypothetical protein MJ245_03950 [Clostridia bacterium]|nr:hypothetical protein [Clostridia bacterium]